MKEKKLYFRYEREEYNKPEQTPSISFGFLFVGSLFALNVFNLDIIYNIIGMFINGTLSILFFIFWHRAIKEFKKRKVFYFVDEDGNEVIKYGKWQ